MKTVLFYGDSNTWGFDPETGGRYPYDDRWTSVCEKKLGKGYRCISSGMNGRMTIFDDPLKACRNGMDGLDYALQTHKPINIFVLMLGTNDLKHTDAEGSAAGMERLVWNLTTANERYSLSSPVFPEHARMLLISPVYLYTDIAETVACDARLESRKLAGLYEKIARQYHLEFLDASEVAEPSQVDGVHLSIASHHQLGTAIAEKILQRE